MRTTAASIQLIRILLGLFCIFFAHFLGRSLARVQQGRLTRAKMTTWLLRTVVTLLGVFWGGGLDAISVGAAAIAAVAFAIGWYLEKHPKEPEDDTKLMFPDR